MAAPGNPRPDAGEARDETFGFFTTSQAAVFRDLVRQGFAQAGLEVTAYADHVVDSSGRVFGLGNVAAECHNDERGERAWREITTRHTDRIVRATDAPSPFDTMTPAELYAGTYVRLVPTADLLQVRAAYAREVAEGVSEVLNVDLPESVAMFLDEHVERFGPLADLRRAGLVNLRAVPFDQHEMLEHQGGRVDILLGDSMFVASSLVVLGDVLTRLGLPTPGRYGVFVAAPFRHQLAFHVLGDATAIPSLNVLAALARAGYDDAPGPVSPDVFWWRDGSLERLTVNEPDGIRIDVGPELTEVLDRLG
ncbi:hypothetical protein [Nocardioides cynanchi]|uniref:hypothetical protein n=1 Tax=Nocardioides cynanchi TaxID=2558918 RepID=UPI00192DD0E4|nr:hypothetical protein [Nocardioides cynanchi]